MTIMRNKFLILIAVFVLNACQNYSYDGPGQDVPTAGNIEFYADKSDSLLVTEWIEMFQINYPKSKVKPIFASHNQLMKWLESDSLKKAFLLNQFLTKDQKDFVAKNRNCTVHETHLAQSSVAFIVHKQSSLTELDLSNLAKQLQNNGLISSGFQSLVYDSWGAPFLQFQQILKFKFNLPLLKKQFNSIYLHSDQSIIDYVSQHNDAIGLISLNYIGNNYSKLSLNNQKKIKIIKLKLQENDISQYPFQSQIKAKQYPIIQNIVAYDLQGYSGLANGFITFVNSQPGQIMTKKNGLIPMNDVGRTIELGTE